MAATLFANLIATALAVPLVVAVGAVAFGTRSLSLIPLGVALLVGVLPNPCTAGVQSIAHELAKGEFIAFRDHWQGFRRYARIAAKAWAASLVVTAVILGNLAFYAHAAGSRGGALHAIAPPLFLLWLLLCILWIAIHLFVFPLLIEQEVKSVWLAYRNAFLMVGARPSIVIIVLPVWIALLVVSSATGLATFIGLALSASIQQNAMTKLLPMFRLRGGA